MGDSRALHDAQAQLRRACAELEERLRAGEAIRAETLLAQRADLAEWDDLALELIYNEFVVREELGQQPTAEEWFARFPQHRERLARLFEVDALLREAPAKPRSTHDSVRVTFGKDDDFDDQPIGWLGGYELLEEIGRGGMGIVYKARQPGIDRLVALKMLRGSEANSAELARLLHEAKLVGSLQHPNIVQIFEVGEHQGQPFLALELAEGGSLDRFLAGQTLPTREAAHLVRDLARAMQHAHAAGIVHRDLKPGNVLLTFAGDRGAKSLSCFDLDGIVPKISDFGLAHALHESQDSQRSTHALGTACYMAPEQAEGKPGWAKPSCDLYALGAILYELLSGRPPHLGETAVQTMALVVTEDPISPRLLRRGLPRDLETICLKCLEKDSSRRYVSAEALADDLDRYLEGHPVQACPLSWPSRLWRRGKRRPLVSSLVGLLMLGIVTLLVGWGHFTTQVAQQRDQARWNEERAVEEKHEADLQRQRAKLNEEAARRELDRARRTLLTATLLRASSLSQTNPARALRLLENPEVCPPSLRDFAWGVLHRHLRGMQEELPVRCTILRAVAWSPDGSWLVCGDAYGTIVVWDVKRNREKIRFAGPPRFEGLAVAADGTIALGGAGVISLHDNEGNQICVLHPRFNNVVYRLLFIGRDKLVAVSQEGTWLWDVKNQQLLGSLRGLKTKVNAVALVAGGWLATGADDRSIRLWDLQTLEEKKLLGTHEHRVISLAASPEGESLVATDWKGAIVVWNVTTGSKRELIPSGNVAWSAAISPDGRRLAWGGNRKIVHVVELAGIADRIQSEGPSYVVHSLAWSPDGRRLAIAGAGERLRDLRGRLRLVDLHSPAWESIGHSTEVTKGQSPLQANWAQRGCWFVSFPNDNELLAVVRDGTAKDGKHSLRRVDLQSGKVRILDRPVTPQPCFDAASSADVGWMGSQRRLSRIDLTGKRRSLPVLSGAVQSLAASPDGKFVAVARRGQPIWTFPAHGSSGGDEVPSPPGPKQGYAIPLESTRLYELAYSPDGTKLAFLEQVEKSMRLHRFDVISRKLLTPITVSSSRCLIWTRDGRSLVVGHEDGSIQIVDATSGRTTATLTGHSHPVLALAISPDGETLASGGVDLEIRLWDLPTGQERIVLKGHTFVIHCLAFSPDGKKLASGSQSIRPGGEILLWQRD